MHICGLSKTAAWLGAKTQISQYLVRYGLIDATLAWRTHAFEFVRGCGSWGPLSLASDELVHLLSGDLYHLESGRRYIRDRTTPEEDCSLSPRISTGLL